MDIVFVECPKVICARLVVGYSSTTLRSSRSFCFKHAQNASDIEMCLRSTNGCGQHDCWEAADQRHGEGEAVHGEVDRVTAVPVPGRSYAEREPDGEKEGQDCRQNWEEPGYAIGGEIAGRGLVVRGPG